MVALSAARSEDSKSLKAAGLNYVAMDAPGKQLDPPILSTDKSSHRGFKHPMLGRLLCPVQFLKDFDKDPPL